MARVPVTDEVVDQLRDVLESGVLDDQYNYVGAGFAAQDKGHEELARFAREADASTYYEAVERAAAGLDGETETRGASANGEP